MAILSTTLLESIDSYVSSIKPISLGPEYSNMDFHSCCTNLVSYRLCKKYYKPEITSYLLSKAINKMISYDLNGITTFSPGNDRNLGSVQRAAIYNVRNKLHEIFSAFRINFNDLEFPSGEGFKSSRGDVSIYSKLKRLDQWTCTRDCFDLFSKIVYHNTYLKRCAKKHFVWCNSKALFRRLINEGKSVQEIPYLIFKMRLRGIMTWEAGSRIVTVPKNNEIDRCINIECTANIS